MRDEPLSSLVSFVGFGRRTQRTRTLRNQLAGRLRRMPPKYCEDECIDGLNEWLAQTFAWYFRSLRSYDDRVELMASNDCFMLSVLYLEGLVDVWTRLESSPERCASLRTVVDLLSRIPGRADQPLLRVEDELFASFLLSNALRNDHLGRPLSDGVSDKFFLDSRLYAVLATKEHLDELVEATRYQCQLGD